MVSTYRRTGALLAVALAAVLTTAAPARAADVFVEVNPSTVQAGNLVGIRASCGDNGAPATVESGAFGTVTVQPQGGVLTAAALVPEQTQAREFRVKLTCPNGRTASTMLRVIQAGQPSRGPATGFGGGAHSDPGDALLLGGVAAILVGAALGVVAVRRRERGVRLVRSRSVN
ncbi:MAG TPA: hypothetical protein VGD43_20285 [Micromonospora sp.]